MSVKLGAIIHCATSSVSHRQPDTVLEWALAGAGAITLIIFAVALQNFFVQPPVLTRGQRFFQDLSVVVGVTHGLALLVLDSASDMWAGIGIAMYAISLALFLAGDRSVAPRADDAHVRLRAQVQHHPDRGPVSFHSPPDLPLVLRWRGARRRWRRTTCFSG